jgi:hypothetical protein
LAAMWVYSKTLCGTSAGRFLVNRNGGGTEAQAGISYLTWNDVNF